MFIPLCSVSTNGANCINGENVGAIKMLNSALERRLWLDRNSNVGQACYWRTLLVPTTLECKLSLRSEGVLHALVVEDRLLQMLFFGAIWQTARCIANIVKKNDMLISYCASLFFLA